MITSLFAIHLPHIVMATMVTHGYIIDIMWGH
jgi:hypothetical protein